MPSVWQTGWSKLRTTTQDTKAYVCAWLRFQRMLRASQWHGMVNVFISAAQTFGDDMHETHRADANRPQDASTASAHQAARLCMLIVVLKAETLIFMWCGQEFFYTVPKKSECTQCVLGISQRQPVPRRVHSISTLGRTFVHGNRCGEGRDTHLQSGVAKCVFTQCQNSE